MSDNFFIPDDDNVFTLEGYKKGSMHYRFNTSTYQVPTWTAKQKLFYKMYNSKDWDYEKKTLPPNETPKEDTIKKCLLVVMTRLKRTNVAIGIEIIDGDNYVAFKSINVGEIKSICKKNNITTNYDSKYACYLFFNTYLNDIIPPDIWHYTAYKYTIIRIRDKNFAKRLSQYFKMEG